jgi:hypothetical protein
LLNACSDIQEDIIIDQASSIIASFSDADKGAKIRVSFKRGNEVVKREVTVVSRTLFDGCFVK